MGEEIELSEAEKAAADTAIANFLDGLALLMENEDQWAVFMQTLVARRKAMN